MLSVLAMLRSPVLLVLVTALLAGCAHTRAPVATGASPKAPVDFEPIRIVTETDPLIGLEAYDGGDLFKIGYQAFEDGDFARTVGVYDVLLEQFPDHPDAVPARFNRALALEKLGDYGPAADGFGEYAGIVAPANSWDAAEGWVRQATLLQHDGRYADSAEPIAAARSIALLDRAVDWQARVLEALAEAHADPARFDAAEFTLNRVRREIRRVTLSDNERFPYESAMVWFAAGQLYRMRAAAVDLGAVVDDPVELDRRLGTKAGLLLEARQHLKRALVHKVAFWSGPSAFALGGVYEDFRRDLLAAPRPASLDEEAGAVYDELLAERTRQFLEKAAVDYREVLKLAEPLRLEQAWVDTIAAALDRCERELITGFRASAEPAARAGDEPGDG